MDYRKWSYTIWALIAILVLASSIIAIYVYGTYFAEPTQIPAGGTIEPNIPLLIATPSVIDWGLITVYGNTTKTVTLKNNSTESETIINMTFETTNWQNTTDLGLTLTWNYTGTNIYAKQEIAVTFTLTSTTIPEDPEVTHFSFDILVTPTMQGDPS